MAIRHREVFPVGSSPDSIAWDIWNDDHVGDVAGLPQDQIDALDAANAPTTGNPFATMADVAGGGGLTTVSFTFNYDELVTLVPSGVVGGDIHIGANLWIWGIGIAVTVPFDDSEAAAGDQPTLENVANDVEYAFTSLFGSNLSSVSLVDGHTAPLHPDVDVIHAAHVMLTGPSGADFIMNCGNAFLANDGTQGTIVVTFLVSPA